MGILFLSARKLPLSILATQVQHTISFSCLFFSLCNSFAVPCLTTGLGVSRTRTAMARQQQQQQKTKNNGNTQPASFRTMIVRCTTSGVPTAAKQTLSGGKKNASLNLPAGTTEIQLLVPSQEAWPKSTGLRTKACKEANTRYTVAPPPPPRGCQRTTAKVGFVESHHKTKRLGPDHY